MAYTYRSRRSARKLTQQSRRNFIITLTLIALLAYFTINWLLPFLVNGIGSVKKNLTPSQKVKADILNSSLAPPVLNIPFEATNSAQINIKGYATADSKVSVFLDDQKIDTVDVSSDGSFEITNIQLVLGTNNIYGKSIDDNSQESPPSKLIKIIYDNEKPSLKINEPEDNKRIQGGDKKVKFSGNTEVGSHVFINDSQIIVDKDGNFSSDQSLNEGDNEFAIKAVDTASNTAELSRKVSYQP